MKTRLLRSLAALAAMLMVLSAVSCQNAGQNTEAPSQAPSRTESPESADPEGSDKPVRLPKEADAMKAALTEADGYPVYQYGEKGLPGYEKADYTSLYAEYGKDITLADVLEDPDTGLAYIMVEGRKLPLGLDFLSRAMIYNCTPSGDYPSEEDAYCAWWRFYAARWNLLLPEIPLYEEPAVMLYRSELSGPDSHPVSAERSLSNALLYWNTKKESDRIIIGTPESFAGQFRYPAYKKETTAGPDLTVNELTNGLELVTLSEDGRPVFNRTVVHDHEEKENEDGSRTYTITLWEDLRFSDGTPVTAKDYLAFPLAFLSAVGHEADSTFYEKAAYHFTGEDTFRFYEGGGSTSEPEGVFSGVRLLGEKTFSLTVASSDLPDANALSALRLTAQYAPMWLGDSEIRDDGKGCYLTEDFYERAPDGHYTAAGRIRQSAGDPETLMLYPFSGPYMVQHYSGNAPQSVILAKNEYYAGDMRGQKASIETVILKTVPDHEVFRQLEDATLDVFTGIKDPEIIREAAAFAEGSQGTVKAASYGLGKINVLHFRADLGPVQFQEVRQALAFLLDRKALLGELAGGLGIAPDGPYTENSFYKKAVQNGLRLQSYPKNEAQARLLLEEGGWVYNAHGGPYVSGVRYKKIPAELLNGKNRAYTASDGSVQTYEKDGFFYMPLAVNFFAVKDTFLSENLKALLQDEALKSAGMLVQVTDGSFNEAMDELYERPLSGYYRGLPLYCAFDAFTREYAVSLEDDSVRFSIDPEEFELFNESFFRDPADIIWLK